VQRNLFCKLGLSADKLTPIEEVPRIHHHVAWFDAAQIIDAMLVNFNLDDDDSDLLDEVLLQHDGTTVVDLDPLTEEV
jgi:hypothetical protein